METIQVGQDNPPVPVDWHDPNLAIPALIEAAGRAYGTGTVVPPQIWTGESEEDESDSILYGT